MKLIACPLRDAYVIEANPVFDERGFFVRTFCGEEFSKLGLVTHFEQGAFSSNKLKGTILGLHFQRAPHEETKIVRCLKGAIWDVIVDLRTSSDTFGKWYAQELTAENLKSFYVPAGFAHGFQTLVDATEVSYQISTRYVPEASTGIRFDDQQLAVQWPLPPSVVSEKDRALPLLKEAFATF